MVGSINPKTFVPRSLEVSKQEQAEKVKPDIQYEQATENLKKKKKKKQQKVNDLKETESKRVNDEQEQKQESSKEEENDKQNHCGEHIDIKV